jgi:hypothetical protein
MKAKERWKQEQVIFTGISKAQHRSLFWHTLRERIIKLLWRIKSDWL